jgi:hypothetical protein
MGLKEGEVITAGMVSKSIERAQKKVEENNFGMRKRLLEYDDVMNAQRRAIYKKRRNALFGDRLAIDIDNMFYELCETTVQTHANGEFQEFEMELIRLIGIESPIGKECMVPTRSIVADNSPYYESGIRIRHQSNNETYAIHLLNGWQRSSIDSLGILPAIGYEFSASTEQLSYRFSGFLGKISHDTTEGIRYYQHLGATYQLHPNINVSASLDMGLQQKKEIQSWVFAPLIMGQWSVYESLKIHGRLEYYHDPEGMIISSMSGISGFGYSMGIDWSYSNAMLFRAEWRQIHAMRDNQDVNILGIHAQWAILNEL